MTISSVKILQKTAYWIKENSACLIVLLTVLLLSTDTLFNIPMAIMSLYGLVYVIRNPNQLLLDQATKTIIFLFFVIWIPMLLSLPDAVHFKRSFKTVFLYAHFLFAAIYIVQHFRNARIFQQAFKGIIFIIIFWCSDAFFQLLTGTDIFGIQHKTDRLSGMFQKYSLGHVLAVFLPLFVDYLRRKNNILSWLLLFSIIIIILLTGRRTAWIMAFTACVGYMIGFLYLNGLGSLYKFRNTGIIIILSICIAAQFGTTVSGRFESALGIFSGDYNNINKATSTRYSLWITSVEMAKSNYINGVGPRGFRHAYRTYAHENDIYISRGREPQTQPHQMFLEIAAETGLLGIAGYFAFLLILFRLCKNYFVLNGEHSMPWVMTTVVAVFPANSHMAFYGSYWSSIIWLTLSLAISALFFSQRPESL